jgi:hypothetical protein
MLVLFETGWHGGLGLVQYFIPCKTWIIKNRKKESLKLEKENKAIILRRFQEINRFIWFQETWSQRLKAMKKNINPHSANNKLLKKERFKIILVHVFCLLWDDVLYTKLNKDIDGYSKH